MCVTTHTNRIWHDSKEDDTQSSWRAVPALDWLAGRREAASLAKMEDAAGEGGAILGSPTQQVMQSRESTGL